MNFHEKVKTLQDYFTAGKFKRVIEGCEVLNKKFPNNSFILNLSGMAYQRLDKDHKAINFFELALKADNANISAMNNLANSLKNTEQYFKAEQIYKKIIKINPSYINAYNNYGNLKYSLNHFNEAIELFLKALKINSEEINILITLAASYQSIGEFEKSKKTTIALTTGLALGGGLELAMSCDYRVGTRRSQFRFPETSIGIFPGLGGTQRTPRICGIEAARYAVLAGNFLDSKTASALGILTHLVDPSDISKTIMEISVEGKPVNKYPGMPRDENNPVSLFAMNFYKNENMESIMSGEIPKGFEKEDKTVIRQMKSLSFTAPIALKIANQLLNDAIATGDDLDSGLALELAELDTIFASKDALEGLSALIEGRRPKYIND